MQSVTWPTFQQSIHFHNILKVGKREFHSNFRQISILPQFPPGVYNHISIITSRNFNNRHERKYQTERLLHLHISSNTGWLFTIYGNLQFATRNLTSPTKRWQ